MTDVFSWLISTSCTRWTDSWSCFKGFTLFPVMRQRAVQDLDAVGLAALDPSPAQSTDVGLLAVLLAEKRQDVTLLPVGSSPFIPERGTQRATCECWGLGMGIEWTRSPCEAVQQSCGIEILLRCSVTAGRDEPPRWLWNFSTNIWFQLWKMRCCRK